MHLDLKATKIALIQSKFHRIIRQRMSLALRPFQLQTADWIILGFLDHRKKPMIISEVATELGIQSSFMTTIIAKLAKRNFITIEDDKTDLRKKYIALAPEGNKVVRLMQNQFEEFFAPLARGVSKSDIETYLKVLKTIISNVEKNKKMLGDVD